jgi:hypothetical protein
MRKPPEAWYWSYDIEPGNMDTVQLPGWRIMRLSAYRNKGGKSRFAALIHKDGGPQRRYVIDLDAAAATAAAASPGERPVAITVDAVGPGPRFSLLFDPGPGPASSLHVDLDEAGLRALIDATHGISDLATYLDGGVRKYAAIRSERSAPSWLFLGVTQRELDAKLREHRAALVRIRGYLEAGKQRFAAVAEPAPAHAWKWYSALDPDAVAKQLEKNQSYPFDLDPMRDEAGVLRFSVVMDREPR